MEMATGEEGAEGPKLGCLLLELELAMVPGWIQDDNGQTYAKEPGRCRQRACFDGDLRDAGREEDGGGLSHLSTGSSTGWSMVWWGRVACASRTRASLGLVEWNPIRFPKRQAWAHVARRGARSKGSKGHSV